MKSLFFDPNRHKLVSFVLAAFFFSVSGYSQKVFSVKFPNQADVKVFKVDFVNQADLKVYKVDFQKQTESCDGNWFFVDFPNQADWKIYFTDFVHQAELKIFFVKFKNQAGWVNKEKKILFCIKQ